MSLREGVVLSVVEGSELMDGVKKMKVDFGTVVSDVRCDDCIVVLRCGEFEVGDIVEVRPPGEYFFFQAIIVHLPGNGDVDVRYVDESLHAAHSASSDSNPGSACQTPLTMTPRPFFQGGGGEGKEGDAGVASASASASAHASQDDFHVGEGEDVERVPLSSLRKVHTGRSLASKRWRMALNTLQAARHFGFHSAASHSQQS